MPHEYVGQTGRTFKVCCKEHIEAIRTNGHNSKFAQHMLGTGHAYNSIDKLWKYYILRKKNKNLTPSDDSREIM
jgi:hypothetical protein